MGKPKKNPCPFIAILVRTKTLPLLITKVSPIPPPEMYKHPSSTPHHAQSVSSTTSTDGNASSSDDEEDSFTLSEALEQWLFNKTLSTRYTYLRRISDFRAWMQATYQRDIDRTKTKHIRMYLNHKSKTCVQIRATIVVIKSCFKVLVKCKILKNDVSAGFDSGKQKPAKHERNLSSDTIRALFRQAQRRKNPSTMVLLQIAVYCGLRIGALSSLACSDIIKTDVQNQVSYKIRVRCGKGQKTRLVHVKKSIGRAIWEYAQSLGTIYLFPSKMKPGKPLTKQALGARIKRLAKAIKKPEISAHFLRHYFASSCSHAGMSLANIQHAMGHSSSHTTGVYLHKSEDNVSAAIDLTHEGEDVTLIHSRSSQPAKSKSKMSSKKKFWHNNI
tara:strand:- start:79 stop:1239 length:1161 start_codon:yes stop_codon:yes gene_type:complete